MVGDSDILIMAGNSGKEIVGGKEGGQRHN